MFAQKKAFLKYIISAAFKNVIIKINFKNTTINKVK